MHGRLDSLFKARRQANKRTPAFMYIEKAPFCVLDITNMQLTSHVGELREIEDNGRETTP